MLEGLGVRKTLEQFGEKGAILLKAGVCPGSLHIHSV